MRFVRRRKFLIHRSLQGCLVTWSGYIVGPLYRFTCLFHAITAGHLPKAWIPLGIAITELQQVAESAPWEELEEHLTVLMERGRQFAETPEAFGVET